MWKYCPQRNLAPTGKNEKSLVILNKVSEPAKEKAKVENSEDSVRKHRKKMNGKNLLFIQRFNQLK